MKGPRTDMTLHPAVERVTARIIERSRPTRDAYLALMAQEAGRHGDRSFMSCSNLAHGFAAALEDITDALKNRPRGRDR